MHSQIADLPPEIAGVLQAGINGSRWKPDFELAAGEPFFVRRKRQAAVLQQRGARIVPVPDAQYIHEFGIFAACVSELRLRLRFGFELNRVEEPRTLPIGSREGHYGDQLGDR